MQSKATTVEEYLAELPEDRRKSIAAVREVVLANLDCDYEEGMQYGMIGYYVPHRVYPGGYHCNPKQPLPFAALASQKNYMSLYLMSVYGEQDHSKWFQQAWAKTGKKLAMGKCCLRFKKIEELALNVIGEAIRRVPARKYIEQYESVIKTRGASASKRTKSAGKSAKSTRRAISAKSSPKKVAKRGGDARRKSR